MNESLKLSLSQKQQQTLAPMQLQLVRMLEMSAPEIEEEIRRQVDENPALEVADDTGREPAADYSQSADDTPYYRYLARNSSPDDEAYEPTAVDNSQSLMDYILSQLRENPDVNDTDMAVARVIAGNIDSNGYLTRDVRAMVDDLAIQEGIETTADHVRRVLEAVRRADPAGIGAVDLRDSLLLQLRRRAKTPAVELATKIVRDYFDLFSLMHFDRLRNLTGATAEQLSEAMEVIRSLNPKPGAQIGSPDDDRTRHITPDFYVEADGDRLTLTLLNRIPRLQIEQSFAADTAVQRRTPSRRDAEANAFIRQRRDEASGFIKVLEMRQLTLFRVMSAIMQWQRDFFLTDDPQTLRPMILKDISAMTGDDISVISRVSAGKFVATQHGVYPLKFFFNERRKEGDETSTTALISRLREIIAAENKNHPLTDAALTDILNSEGYDVARRTVAKYREKLGIPVGRLRRSI